MKMTQFENELNFLFDGALSQDMPQKMRDILLRDMPQNSTLRLETDIPDYGLVTIEDHQMSFSYGFMLGNNGYCKFESAMVKTRGSNLSAIVMRNMTEILPELGVRSVDIYAAEIGAYLWGRAGFAPHQGEWARIVPKLQKRLDYLVSVNGVDMTQAADAIRQNLAQNNPKNLWKIADRKDMLDNDVMLGKAMLMAWTPDNFPQAEYLTRDVPKELSDVVSWRGKLDLQDSDCDDRLYDYIESAEQMAVQYDREAVVKRPVFKP